VVRLTQGSPPGLTLKAAIDVKKPIPIRRTRSGEGSEGGRFTDSTDDSEPVKPGNSVEDKTLTTRKEAWMPQYRHWDMGSRGREAIVIPSRSRNRAANKDEGVRKPKGDDRIYGR